MNKIASKLLHNCILNPKKFWKQTISILVLCIIIFSALGFAIGNYKTTDTKIEQNINFYSKLESELKLMAYLNKDSSSHELKIKKLESISGINIPNNINQSHLDLMVITAAYYDIPLRIFLRTAAKESNFNPNAISHKNAKGYYQIRDQTYKTYYRKIYIDDKSPESNIRLAGYILKDLKFRYKSWDLVLAAYNAGPRIVDSSKGIPNYKETKNYIKFILE